ncbi:Enkurin TRPC channel interacting protein [Fasciola hepatica]|uniref:Enkurin TRPC channel interacting protein n=1 Tax=Fasciola hepatica TaxID=6192 RepID=A0A2H1C935_FASHE|nr:Enkurin TRPC channel interacting protein [Fasciola hepatica]
MTDQDPGTQKVPCDVEVQLSRPPVGPREYIYNLIPQQRSNLMTRYACLPKIRHKKYTLTESKNKEAMKTMGPPSHDPAPPLVYPDKYEYLRKHRKQPFERIQTSQPAERTVLAAEENAGKKKTPKCLTVPKAPLPTRKAIDNALNADGIPSKCFHRERHKINWITRNAIAAITQTPGSRVAPEHRNWIVDTRKGDKFPLKSNRSFSGLEPIYVYKKGMGKVPTYLLTRAKLIKKTKDLLTHYVNEKELQNTDYLLTEEQREQLLTGLKAAWDRYNRKYLGLASINDTMKGRMYKLYLEKQLDSLQTDIELVESHQFLFVEAPKDPDGKWKTIDKICV